MLSESIIKELSEESKISVEFNKSSNTVKIDGAVDYYFSTTSLNKERFSLFIKELIDILEKM